MSLRVCNKSEITLPLNAKKIILWKQNIIQIHIPVWVSISDGHWQISIHFQKIREIVIALLKRNQISAWPPMQKSDFRMNRFHGKFQTVPFFFILFEKTRETTTNEILLMWKSDFCMGHVEIWFPHGGSCGNLIPFQ